MLNKIFSKIFIGIIKFYQNFFAYFLGGSCRFTPSCSNYGIEAIKEHGALSGSWLTVKRICRCQPFGGSGYDPVPKKDVKTGKNS